MEDRKFRRSLLSTRDVKDISVLGLNENGYSKSVDPLKSRISMSDLYGKEKPLPTTPQECDYYFETREDFDARRDQIIAENNNDLSQKTFGFGDGITSLSSIFENTPIISTPKMIFCKKGNYFDNAFALCESLKSISDTLFINCINAESFSETFYNCSSLNSIPKSLFSKSEKVKYFEATFSYCNSLTSIPSGLFDNCVIANNFELCFKSCKLLTTVPFELFDKCSAEIWNVNGCFESCHEITSALPDVWNKDKFPDIAYGNGYAYECAKVANYSQIPVEFKFY